MNLKQKITEKLKTAMKEKNMQKLTLLRNVQSEIKNEEIKTKTELTDEGVIKVLSRMAKQRKDSIEQFKKGGREELAEDESKELEILQNYLPKQMDDAEVEKIVSDTIKEVGADGPQDMGKVMGALMPKIQGKADGSVVSQMVKEKLTQ